MEFFLSVEAQLGAVGLLLVLLLTLVGVRRSRAKRVVDREILPIPAAEPAPPETAAVTPPRPVVPEPLPIGRLRAALEKTRDLFRTRLEAVFREPELERLLPALEEALVSADVGMATTKRILDSLNNRLGRTGGVDEATVRAALRDAIEEVLGDGAEPDRAPRPWVILVVGVNGVGKTTTIGKLAARLSSQGKKVLLVAADTFRAAAIDQLAIWAERVGVDLVRHQGGADPGAVAYDGIRAAVARAADVVIVDTAGRLHTRENLMDELRKVARVIDKALPGAPHEVLLVLDATTGQNALRQAKVFSEALRVSGIVLTKLDGTARGGAALAVRQELGVPIRYIGVGEHLDDLRPFSASEFARGLVGDVAA